jgi:hypothetical protein
VPPRCPAPSSTSFFSGRPRYDWSGSVESDRNFIALDVVPAHPGGTSTMTLRAINERGVEFDRVVFKRTVKH